MIIAAATQKMIEFYKGNIHDIDHFLKVWAMAKTIGEIENRIGIRRRFWSLPQWCMTSLACCAAKIRQHKRKTSGA